MISLLLSLLAAAPAARAWGDLGHETIAYVAQDFVSNGTQSWAQSILGSTSTSYLASVATWADSYRYTSAGSFSKPFHYIDAEDSPPTSCSVDYNRDCGSAGCSVSAIANYTARVQSRSISATEVQNALKFLVHLLGDITQPLHDEALAYGGNDITVTYKGASTNLHHIWDTEIPETIRGTTSYSLTTARSWATHITYEIKSGFYEAQRSSWLNGLNISNPVSSAMTWASDANAYVCSTVMPKGATALESGDLYPTYYNTVNNTVQLQVAKAGYRLAAWLDAIAAEVGVAKVRRSDAAEENLPVAADFMPEPRALSEAKKRRMAVGWDCNHSH